MGQLRRFAFDEIEVRGEVRIKQVTLDGEPTGIIVYLYDSRDTVSVIKDGGHALRAEYDTIDEFSADLREFFGRSKKWWKRAPTKHEALTS